MRSYYCPKNAPTVVHMMVNLVEAVEIEWKEGDLKNMELFLFTDNFVVEQAFYKGYLREQGPF